VLRSVLNVVVGLGVSAMLLWAIIATETTKRGEAMLKRYMWLLEPGIYEGAKHAYTERGQKRTKAYIKGTQVTWLARQCS
jgi:hypothetical protein